MPESGSARLDLVLADRAMWRAALAGAPRLAALLGAELPPDWPPPLFDEDALRHAAAAAEAPDHDGTWGSRWLVRRSPRRLVGIAGFYGPPVQGVVLLGYAVVASEQGQGFATEAVEALVRFALADPGVGCVAAETLPELTASRRVLEKAGFIAAGPGVTHERALRFARRRG